MATTDPLAAVGLVFGIIGTLGFIVVSISCCILWRRSHKQLVLLKREVERGACTSRTPVDPNMVPLAAPASPLIASSNPVAITPPLDITPSHQQSESRNYSYVNKLSLLPAEARTAANLEGETLPLDREELLEQYLKDRADYEDQQLVKMTELRAQRAMGTSSPSKEATATGVPGTTPTHTGATPTHSGATPTQGRALLGNYEEVEPELLLGKTSPNMGAAKAPAKMGPYENPADAIVGKVGVTKKTASTGQKKVWSMGTPGAAGGDVAGGEYTPVFNTLPKGTTTQSPPHHVTAKTRRCSDSTPTRVPHQPAGTTHNYENNPLPSPSRNRTSNTAEDSSPEHPGPATTTAGTETKTTPTAGGQPSPNHEEIRRDDSRQSKRKPAKEVVEFDPNKPKKFRMSSSVKKPKKKGAVEVDDNADLKVDETDSGSAGKPEAAPGAAPEAKTTPAMKEFDIKEEEEEGQSGALSYAVVNIGDKKKNRLERDDGKVEGSGVPQHYRVPIASS